MRTLAYSRTIPLMVVGSLLLAVAGCDQPSDQSTAPNSPQTTEPKSGALTAEARIAGLASDDFSETVSGRLARQVPEFGGVFIDTDGALTAYITHGRRAAAARKALTSEWLKTGRPIRRVKILAGRFSFSQLWQWHTALRSTFNTPGVVVSELDERNNQLRVGITDPQARSAVERAVTQAGVPAKAVVIELTAAPALAISVRNKIRPTQGGTQILGDFTQNGVHSTFTCTYGLNVRNNADPANRYMLVNSHCTQNTPNLGGFINANIHQPDGNSPAIGTEVSDPATSTGGGCPVGAHCRFSDAALVRMAATEASALGTVARTTARKFLPTIYASLTIDANKPTFTLSGPTEMFIGDTVEKVGRTTGWTAGVITSTCTDVNIGGYIRKCSGVVSAGAGEGDSGSPVFWLNTRTQRYWVDGLLFGGILNGSDGKSGNTYYFSRWNYINSELGGQLVPN